MKNETIRVLLVDNQVDAREWLAEELHESYGFAVDTVNDGNQAISRVRESGGQYDVLLIDLRLGSDPDGIETMKVMQAEYPDIETIIITGYASIKDGIRAIEQGACNFVLKPFDHQLLAIYIHSADERRRLRLTARERDWLRSLHRLDQSISSSLTPEQVAEQVYNKIADLFPQADSFYIAIHKPEQKQLRFLLAFEQEKIEGVACEDSFGLAGEIIRSKRPLVIDDLTTHRPRIKTRSFNPGKPVKSFAGFPLINGNELIGVLSVQSYKPRAFNEDHMRILQEFTNRAAIAIENALLHQQTARRLSVLSGLYDTITAIRQQSSLESVLDVIVHKLQELFALDTCTIGLLNMRKKQFDFLAMRGFQQRVSKPLEDLPPELVKRVFEASEPIIFGNIDDLPGLRNALVVPNLKSFAILPLHLRAGKLLGVITLGSKSINGLEGLIEDKNLLMAFANQAAIAIEDNLLREDSHTWAQYLESFNQDTLNIANDTDIKEILRNIIQMATELTLCTGGGIYLFKGDRKRLVLKAACGLPREMEDMKIESTSGVLGKIVKTEKPFAQSNYYTWQGRVKAFDKFHFTAVAGAPIFSSKGQLLGCIAIHTDKPGETFGDMELRLLSRLGQYAGAELEKAKLSGTLGGLRKLSETLQLLLDFNNTLAASNDLDDALRIFVERLTAVCPTTCCHILLRTRDAHRLRVRKAFLVRRKKTVKWHSSEGEPCAVFTMKRLNQIAQQHTSVVLRKGEQIGDEILSKIDGHLKIGSPLQSALLIPLRIGTEIVGLCFLGETRKAEENDSQRVSLTRENIRLAEMLVIQAAASIENFRSFEVEKERAKTLKRLNEIGNAIAATRNQDQVLDLISRYGREVLNAEVCSIFLMNRNGLLTLKASKGSPENYANEPVEIEVRRDSGLTGYIAWKGEIFKEYGERLQQHWAVQKPGDQPHLPSGHCESLLAIPLKHGSGTEEELIGLIKIENKKDQTGKLDKGFGFDRDDELILKTLADYAVAAIQNARLFDQSRALQEVARAVNSSLHLKQVLELILKQLSLLIPFYTCSVQLLVGDEFRVFACEGFDDEEKVNVLRRQFPASDPSYPNSKVMTTKQPFTVRNILGSDYAKHFDDRKPSRASSELTWLGLPLLLDKEVIGMIAVEGEAPKCYTREHINLGMAFADHVVSAIANAKLFEQSQDRLNNMSAQQHLLSFTEAMIRQDDMGGVLKEIADTAVNREGPIRADIVLIFLYNPDNERVDQEPVHAGAALNYPDKLYPISRESVVYKVLDLQAPIFRDEAVGDPLLDREFIKREEVKSSAALPLWSAGEPVGVMFVNFRSPHKFTDDEVDWLKRFAREASDAIHPARHFQTINQQLEGTRNAAVSLVALSGWAHHAARNTFTLRNDAITLQRFLPKLLNGCPPWVLETLQRIEAGAQEIAEIIPQTPANTDERKRVNLSAAFERAFSKYAAEFQSKGIQVENRLGELPAVQANDWLVGEAFKHLIQNSFQAMANDLREGKRHQLSLIGSVKGPNIFVQVADTGPGIPPEIEDDLFTRRISSNNQPRSGVGLMLARLYLNACDGNIRYNGSAREGAAFIIQLPKAE
jgi:Response regulator containing CheY-like receiver, AAA-type ATPase, and DNA-binding domains